MSTNLIVVGAAPNLPAALSPDLTAAVDLAKAEKAVSTRKAYGTDFRLFKAWCEAKGVPSLPAHSGVPSWSPSTWPTSPKLRPACW